MKQLNILTIAVLFLASAFVISCKEVKPVEQKDQRICISDSMQKLISLDTAKITNINNALSLSGEISFDENHVVKVFSIQ